MIEVNPDALDYAISTGALDTALKAALPGKVLGVSTYGANRPISIFLQDSATEDDEAIAISVAEAHDPVFLSTDKTEIAADGSSAATITVRAPKPDTESVTLVIAASGRAPINWPIAITDGVGSDTLSSKGAGTITITVQDADNRSTDSIVITAR